MSYFYNNKIYDDYILDGVINPADGNVIYKDIIEIFNNESLRLNFSNLDFRCSNYTIKNHQLSKIIVDWGDGKIDKLSKSLMNKSSSIGTYDPLSWKQITHLFNVDKRYEYNIEDQENLKAVLPKISITLINTFNDRVTVYIPYKIVYKSLYDIGACFSMMEANVTNDNLTSYVLKEYKDNTVVITMSRDWKKIYGSTSEVITIKDTNISPDFSDEFVNEDSIVWDWKSVPQVDLTVTYSFSITNNVYYFYTKFNEISVNLDSWTPKCFKIGQPNKELVVNYNDIDKRLNVFNIYNYDGLQKKSLENGIYKTYLEVVGINDIQGESGIVYNSVPDIATLEAYPSKLLSDGLLSSKTITDKEFELNFGLGTTEQNFDYNIYPQMIKEARVTLIPKTINGESADSAIRFQYDILGNLKDGKLTIPTKSIPNGTYTYQTYVSDVLGHEENSLYKDAYTLLYKEDQAERQKQFVINYSNIGNVNFPEKWNEITSEEVTFKWSIEDATEFDIVQFNMYRTSDNGVKEIVLNERQAYDKFSSDYNQTENATNTINFWKKYTPQQIDDGEYTVQVSHILNMTSFGGDRKNTKSSKFTFNYPRPDVEIKDVIPYIKINRNNSQIFQPYIRIIGSEKQGNVLRDIAFHHRIKDSEIVPTKYSTTSLTVDYPVSSLGVIDKQTEYQFDFSSYKAKDLLMRRVNKLWSGQNVDKFFKRKYKRFDNLLKIPNTKENIKASSTRYMRQNEPMSSLTPKDVIIESVVDINKTHYFVHNGKKYFYAENCDFFEWNNEIKPLVFSSKLYTSIVSAKQNEQPEKYVRFYSEPDEIPFIEGIELQSAENYVKKYIIIDSQYNKSNDTFNLIFNLSDGCPLKTQQYQQTINAKFQLCDIISNQVIFEGDFRKDGLNGKTVSNIPLGVYDIKWVFDSLYTSSKFNSFDTTYTQYEKLKMFVQPDDTIGNVKITEIPLGDGNSSFMLAVSWELYHVQASDIMLHIKHGTHQQEYPVQNYRYYNPSTQFSKSEKIDIWFTLNSDKVNWTDKEKKIQLTSFQ